MDSSYLQRLRFQLQKRFRRLNSCGFQLFHSGLVQYWNYLQAQPLTHGILARMQAEAPNHEAEVEAITHRQQIELFEDEKGHNHFVFRIVEYCARQPLGNGLGPELTIGRALARTGKHEDSLNSFRETFLEPFYEFLDDALDQQAAVLSLLIKYKRKVEWFERNEILSAAEGDERTLARHLYAYLFDQGLEFQVEPKSVSGEADLVASDLVLDAKVFDGGRRGIKYLASGVHQVHTYARDYNQEVGYLVVYKICPDTIDFTFAKVGQLVPSVTTGGKTIYILVVDACAHENPASKRGALKCHSVAEELLVQTAAEELTRAGLAEDVQS